MALVLIAHADDAKRAALEEALGAAGHEVRSVAGARDALLMMASHEFDAAVMGSALGNGVDGEEWRNGLSALSKRGAVVMLGDEMAGGPDGAAERLGAGEEPAAVVNAVARGLRLRALRDEVSRLRSELDRTRKRLRALEQERLWDMVKDSGWYQVLIENVPDVVWRTDAQGRILFVNPAVRRVLGLSVEECLGRPINQYMPEPSIKKINRWIEEAQKSKPPRDHFFGHVEYYTKAGDTVPFEIHVAIVRNSRGDVLAFEGISRDLRVRVAPDGPDRE
ncbi:MAG: PAS domain S-box protein [Deltaproteobacteria bacterium]|nr:PAS domain S-box protein [Deltaproteobacteria bacterium]